MTTGPLHNPDTDQLNEIVEYVAARPAVYSTEVADLLDLHRNGAVRRLNELKQQGRIKWRRPHEHIPKMWYVPE